MRYNDRLNTHVSKLNKVDVILIFSLFKIPEDSENFTITLLNVRGGARLGNKVNASLEINKNDDPIYFSGKLWIR